jgi:hypothetical protein
MASPVSRGTEDGEVIGFRRAGSKDEGIRLRVKQTRKLPARELNDGGRLPASSMIR